MSNKVTLFQSPPLSVPTPSQKEESKTAKVAADRFPKHNRLKSVSLKNRQLTWKTPFVAFLNLIANLFSFLTRGNSTSTPQNSISLPRPSTAPIHEVIPKPARAVTPEPLASTGIFPRPKCLDETSFEQASSLDMLLKDYEAKIREIAPKCLPSDVVQRVIEKELAKITELSKTSPLDLLQKVAFSPNVFKRIKTDLDNLKIEQRQRSESWIKNKIKKVTEFRRSSTEKIVLKGLGYKVSAKGEEFLREAMIFMLESYLKEPNLPSLEQLKTDFSKWAFAARLREAGVPPSEVDEMKKIFQEYEKELESLMLEADEEVKKLVLASNLPEAQDYLQNLLFEHHCASIERYLQQVLIGQPANRAKLLASFKQIPENVQKGIAWFKKHSSLMHTEFVQGKSDVNEALGSGVCAGICLRFVKQSLQSPTEPTSKIAIRSIEPVDRINQAYHRQNLDSRGTDFLFPPEILKKWELKEKQRLSILTKGEDGDLDVFSGLKETLEQAAKTKINNHFVLAWGKHATALRFDSQNNKFLFFDPNFGTLEFKKGTRETLNNLAERMATAYVQLYQWAYGERTYMRLQQITPLPTPKA